MQIPKNSNNEINEVNKKKYAKISLVLLFLLLICSVYFYKERMLFIDAPHVLFRIINDGSLQISENRYGSFITQLVPLIGVKLNLTLKILMILYSASFYIFICTVALFIYFKFKNYNFLILLSLYFTLFVSDTFFWPNNEVHQGITWLFLSFTLIQYIAHKNINKTLLFILYIVFFSLSIWTHPLVMFVAIYLWTFCAIYKKEMPFTKLQLLLFTLILFVICYLKFYQGMHHGYDSSKIETVTNFNFQKIISLFYSPQMNYFVHGCLFNYSLFTFIFLSGLIALLIYKKYFIFIITIFASVGYILLICITYHDLDSQRFYIESEYMPLSIITSAPFVFYLLPKINLKYGTIILISIFAIRFIYILHSSTPFTNRIALIKQINEKMKEKKLTKTIIQNENSYIDSFLIDNWALPVESLIYSKLSGDTLQSTFLFYNSNKIDSSTKFGKDTLIGCWELRASKNINKYYFNIDTTTFYLPITYNALMQ